MLSPKMTDELKIPKRSFYQIIPNPVIVGCAAET